MLECLNWIKIVDRGFTTDFPGHYHKDLNLKDANVCQPQFMTWDTISVVEIQGYS